VRWEELLLLGLLPPSALEINMPELLHGTAAAYVPDILRDGLVPKVTQEGRDLDPPCAVWLTDRYSYALKVATQGGRREGVVLLVKVKARDLESFGPLTWLCRSTIPPKRIRPCPPI
jgi:RNA:NAD 2'-phosphotransferase (TPT1/KptA family)